MAIIKINLNDQVSTWLNKTNNLSTGVGDIEDLPAQDSNVVDAINRISPALASIGTEYRDSAGIVDISRNSISVIDNGGLGALSYSASTGAISYTGADQGDIRSLFSAVTTDDSGPTIDYDIANGSFKIASASVSVLYMSNNTITSAKFNNATSLIIYDDAGSVVKTIYSPGN